MVIWVVLLACLPDVAISTHRSDVEAEKIAAALRHANPACEVALLKTVAT